MKKVILIIVALIVLFLIVGVILPAEYSVERSITIEAPVETVFDQVNDLEKNRNWSPWEENDPTAEFEYGPVVVGVGAYYDWRGDEVGTGRMTITGVEPNRRVDTDLAFGDHTTANASFSFDETARGVEATWRVSGDYGNNLLARYFGLIVKGVIEENFERGLANLKRVAEAAPPTAVPAPVPLPEPATPPSG